MVAIVVVVDDDDGKLNGDASLRMGDDGCECVGVVVPDVGQFRLPNVFSAFTTVELDGYGGRDDDDDDGRMSWKGEVAAQESALCLANGWHLIQINKKENFVVATNQFFQEVKVYVRIKTNICPKYRKKNIFCTRA